MTTAKPTGTCLICDRPHLSLTKAGKIRWHTRYITNSPAKEICPGYGQPPKESK